MIDVETFSQLKYLELTLCLVLIATVFNAFKLSDNLLKGIRYIFGDLDKRTRRMQEVIDEEERK